MGVKDFPSRAGHPVNDPEAFVRHYDRLVQRQNIDDQIAKSLPLAADEVALFSAADNALRKVTLAQLALGSGLRGAFSAYRNAAQTGLTGSAFNKVNLNAEIVDVDSWFDSTTNFRYLPLVAGTYFFAGCVTAAATVADTPIAAVYKNGTIVASGNYTGFGTSTGNNRGVVSGITTLNGSTDYIELYAFVPNTVTQVEGTSAIQTNLCGFRVSA